MNDDSITKKTAEPKQVLPQTVNKVTFTSRKGLGNEEFPNWNPQPEFTSGEENSEFQGF